MRNAECGLRNVECPYILCAFLLFLPAVAFAGPIVTIELKDGRKIEAEIQSFYDGRFSVTDRQTKEVLDLADSSIAAIDFGDAAREMPPPGFVRNLTFADVRTLAVEGRFPMLWRTFRTMGPARLKDLDGQLAQQLDGTGLTPAARRDLSLARVLSLQVLGQAEKSRSLDAKLHKDFPGDAAVQRFEREMQKVKEWAAERSALHTAPEKKPAP